MATRPEVFISAASKDLKSCRQLVRDALLTLGCVPIVQDHFPPGAGEVRAMLRERIAGCHAVIHLAGECYGFEPRERGPSEPRRSYTQLEYDIARELGKPLYTFLCAPDFPYDAHEPEPEEIRLLQEVHRAALTAGDNLYLPIKDTLELNLRVRELQTRVETLSRDLRKTRSWLVRGVAAALVALAIIGGVLFLQSRRAVRTEQKIAQVSDELDRYRQAVKALADRYGKDAEPGRKLTDQEKFDRALAAVAAQQKISVGELQTWMDLFVTQVRANPGADFYDRALADFAEKQFSSAASNASKAAEQYRTQRVAAEKEAASANDRAAKARENERRALTLAGDAEDAAGHYAAMIEPCRQALALVEQTAEPLVWCDAARKLAKAYWQMGRYTDAEPLMRTVVEKRTALLGREHPDTLSGIHGLAALLDSKGDLAEAETLCRQCLEGRKRILGEDHSDTIDTVAQLAIMLAGKGSYTEAETLFRQCLAARERTLGRDSPQAIDMQGNLAAVLFQKGDLEGGEALCRQCLEARERTLGKEHPDTLLSLDALAGILSAKSNYAAAEPLYRRCLEVRERTLGKDHPATLLSISNLAVLLDEMGDVNGSETLQRRCLEARERTLGKEHPDTLTSVNNLANELLSKDDLPGAEALFRRALEAQERTLGPEHPETLRTVNNLATVLSAKSEIPAAEALYRRALEANERLHGKEYPETLSCINNLAGLLLNKGDQADAEPLFRRALEVQERILGKAHPDTARLAFNLSLCLMKQGRIKESLPLAEEAVAGARTNQPENHPDRINYERLLNYVRHAAETGQLSP